MSMEGLNNEEESKEMDSDEEEIQEQREERKQEANTPVKVEDLSEAEYAHRKQMLRDTSS